MLAQDSFHNISGATAVDCWDLPLVADTLHDFCLGDSQHKNIDN